MDLNITWFLLVGILVIGYAILDGFDLGVGSLYYLFAKNDQEKRVLLSSIGPFWDGNEVWLLTGGGALFAAFPMVYATVFSGFYLAMMLVLFGLILRAVSIEFRNKAQTQVWRSRLDFTFFLGSFLPALLFGVAIGNVAGGIPIDDASNYTGGFFGLLNPYALLLGVLGLFGFLLQGTTYVLLKTKGEIQERAKNVYPLLTIGFIVLWILGTIYTYVAKPFLFTNYFSYPVLFAVPLLVVIGLAVSYISYKNAKFGSSFAGSSLSLAGIILTLVLGMFPNWVIATDPQHSLSIYNAASSPLTLKTMLIIALIGVPIVLFYTIYVYRVFKGKTETSDQTY